MKRLLLLAAMLLILCGCASFEEAYHLDREFGMASQAAWDKQVAFPEGRHGDRIPETLDGVAAEQVMKNHTESYGKPAEEIEVFRFGLQ